MARALQNPSTDPDADRLPLGISLLGAGVATAVLLPVLWLFITVVDVGASRSISLLTRDTTIQVFVNSAILVVTVTLASILIGVPLAYLTTRTTLPYKRVFTIAVTLPLVIPSYIGAFAFVSAFGPRGEFQRILAPYGIESLPQIYGLEGTVLVITLYTYPYVFITTRAALLAFDTTLIDAARTLRHSRWDAFKRVVVPQIQPATAAGALLVALYALSDFGTPAIMRYEVFTKVIYTEYRLAAFGDPGLAQLLSLQLLAVTLVILAVENRLRGNERFTAHASGGRRAELVKLGRFKWPAFGFIGFIISLALIVPIIILVMWLVRGGTTSAGVPFQASYAVNSLGVSGAAALLAVIAGLPVAYLAAHHRNRLSNVIERATYVGYAVPGVVMGLAIVFFGARYLSSIYQTLPLLIFAYVARFLPQSVGATRAAFLQVDDRLTEAARTLGRTPISTFRSVTLPLIAPGLLGGAALVFLTTMKELPATLLLRPSGFDTLVTHIWRAEREGVYADAAIPALILVFVSALSIFLILSREGYDVEK